LQSEPGKKKEGAARHLCDLQVPHPGIMEHNPLSLAAERAKLALQSEPGKKNEQGTARHLCDLQVPHPGIMEHNPSI